MATAIDVAKYIKAKQHVYGDVQLQKLVYYAQAWSLAWDGRPLFEERVEAWRMGPVVRALRFRHDDPDDSVLTDAERSTVDAVLEFYGDHNGQALAHRSHSESPWADAWEKRPEGSDRCSEEITHEAMRRYYTRLALTSEATPTREPVTVDADPEEALRIAAANAERWRETLAILAQ